jgi:hypothetical protein
MTDAGTLLAAYTGLPQPQFALVFLSGFGCAYAISCLIGRQFRVYGAPPPAFPVRPDQPSPPTGRV